MAGDVGATRAGRRGVLRALATVSALTVALVACGGGSDGGGSGSGDSKAAPDSTRAPAKAGLDLDALTWTRSPIGAPGAGNLNDVVTDGKIFVTGGLLRDGAAGAVPIWTSVDGTIWKPATGPASAFPADAVVTELVHDGDRFVAFGRKIDGGTLAWTSPDGKRWSEYRAPGFPVDETSVPSAAAMTDEGLVLVVIAPSGPSNRMLWAEADGRWRSRGPVPGTGETGDYVPAIAGEGSGSGLVAMGESERDAAAWTSPNGSSWTAATVVGLDPATYEQMSDGIAGGPGFVGVGVRNSGGHEVAAAWTSRDGKQWQPAGEEAGAFAAVTGSSSSMDAVTDWSDGLLGAGNDGPAVTVWASERGTTWSRLPDDPALRVRSGTSATVTGIAVANGHVVAAFRERRFDGSTFVTVGLGIVSGTSRS